MTDNRTEDIYEVTVSVLIPHTDHKQTRLVQTHQSCEYRPIVHSQTPPRRSRSDPETNKEAGDNDHHHAEDVESPSPLDGPCCAQANRGGHGLNTAGEYESRAEMFR